MNHDDENKSKVSFDAVATDDDDDDDDHEAAAAAFRSPRAHVHAAVSPAPVRPSFRSVSTLSASAASASSSFCRSSTGSTGIGIQYFDPESIDGTMAGLRLQQAPTTLQHSKSLPFAGSEGGVQSSEGAPTKNTSTPSVPSTITGGAAPSTSSYKWSWTAPHPPEPSIWHFSEFYHARIPGCMSRSSSHSRCSSNMDETSASLMNHTSLSLEELAAGLRRIFGQLSLQAVYQDAPMAAHCTSCCGGSVTEGMGAHVGTVQLTLTVLRCHRGGRNRSSMEEEEEDVDGMDYNSFGEEDDEEQDGSPKPTWLVEVSRRSGDSLAFHMIARSMMDKIHQLYARPQPLPVSPPPSASTPVLTSHRLPAMSASMMEQYLAAVTASTTSSYDEHEQEEEDDGVGSKHPTTVVDLIIAQLSSPLFHEQRLGLEALVNATDTTRTLHSACLEAGRALLLSVVGVGNHALPTKKPENEDPHTTMSSSNHECLHRIIRMALESNSSSHHHHHGDYDCAREDRHLALRALVNALYVAEPRDVQQFVQQYQALYQRHVCDVLLHNAATSAAVAVVSMSSNHNTGTGLGIYPATEAFLDADSLDLARASHSLDALQAVIHKLPPPSQKQQQPQQQQSPLHSIMSRLASWAPIIQAAYEMGKAAPHAQLEQSSRSLLTLLQQQKTTTINLAATTPIIPARQ